MNTYFKKFLTEFVRLVCTTLVSVLTVTSTGCLALGDNSIAATLCAEKGSN